MAGRTLLEETQECYEQRFNCGICMSPKFKMVYGTCQHRICVDCLYCDNDIRRHSMDRCPTCQRIDAFPVIRPDIPEDNIENQRCLGVRSCSNNGCLIEVWEWELEEHLMFCPNRADSPAGTAKRRRSQPVASRLKASKQKKGQRLSRSISNVQELSRLRPRHDRVLTEIN